MPAQGLSFVQAQHLKLSPQLYQSIKLMELPLMDLREKIAAELERNPALELVSEPASISLDADIPRNDSDDYFESTSDPGFAPYRGDNNEHQQFIEGIPDRGETLQDHLLWQLRLQPLDEPLRTIAELLIQNLDANGFYIESPETLAPDSLPDALKKAIALVQSFEPVGCCTAGYEDSLRIQSRLIPEAPDGVEDALDFLPDLERGKITAVAKKIGRTVDQTRNIIHFLSQLSPFPGRSFAAVDTHYVSPDVQVLQKNGDLTIIINNDEIPVLGINPFFIEQASSQKTETRAFARENIRDAKCFISAVNRRNQTLLRLTNALVHFQRPFFLHGPRYLLPLSLKDVSEELELHESTISRAANGKYLQSEWGLFEIRHFFTNSISGVGSSGSSYSKGAVKAMIQELIADETWNHSDQEIADILAGRGITLARRTVAKYRNELKVGSSHSRK